VEGVGERVTVKVAFAPIGFESFEGKFKEFPIVSGGCIGLSTSAETVGVVV
jgi:hypothetical protein